MYTLYVYAYERKQGLVCLGSLQLCACFSFVESHIHACTKHHTHKFSHIHTCSTHHTPHTHTQASTEIFSKPWASRRRADLSCEEEDTRMSHEEEYTCMSCWASRMRAAPLGVGAPFKHWEMVLEGRRLVPLPQIIEPLLFLERVNGRGMVFVCQGRVKPAPFEFVRRGRHREHKHLRQRQPLFVSREQTGDNIQRAQDVLFLKCRNWD